MPHVAYLSLMESKALLDLRLKFLCITSCTHRVQPLLIGEFAVDTQLERYMGTINTQRVMNIKILHVQEQLGVTLLYIIHTQLCRMHSAVSVLWSTRINLLGLLLVSVATDCW